MSQENETIKRLHIQLNLKKPEDKAVWNILKKQKNLSAYIRKAILLQEKGAKMDPDTIHDIESLITATIGKYNIKRVISDTIREVLQEELQKQPERKEDEDNAFVDPFDHPDPEELKDNPEDDPDYLNLEGLEDFL